MILSRAQRAIILAVIKKPGIYQRDAYRRLLRNHSEYYLWLQIQKLNSAGHISAKRPDIFMLLVEYATADCNVG